MSDQKPGSEPEIDTDVPDPSTVDPDTGTEPGGSPVENPSG
ncbi:hypothetical protein [Herbiconiux sp. VKM Ac-2851]|nr:hypothetical protein [Herbiconiux sp. VKM Ac-2851]